MNFIKKHLFAILFIGIVLYIVIGTLAPFAVYSNISDEKIRELTEQPFLKNEIGTERAMILETAESAWEERIRLMDQAKTRIVLTTFDLREGKSSEDLLSVLLHKASEGVNVQILVDGMSGFLQLEGHPLFYALSTHPNVEMRLYNPICFVTPWKLQGRMHDKYVLIDDRAYIMGGRNSFDYFIGNYEAYSKSLDREVLVYNTDPKQQGSIGALYSYFESIWNMPETKPFHNDESLADHPKVAERREFLESHYNELKKNHPDLFSEFDYETVTCPIEAAELVTNPQHIYEKEPVVFFVMTELMKRAEKSVVVHTPYIVCNDYMYDRLTEAASSVPNAKFVINSVENGDNLVASSDYLRNKKNVIKTGFDLYEYDGGTSSHGKSMVIDDEIAVIGSYNFDLRSTYMDTEMMLVIKSQDLARELNNNMDHFEKDCRYVIDEERYEVPEHVHVREISKTKECLMHVIGFLLKPFRYVI